MKVGRLTIEVIRSDKKLEAKLWWDVHIRNSLLILVDLREVEVLGHFLEDDTAVSPSVLMYVLRSMSRASNVASDQV